MHIPDGYLSPYTYIFFFLVMVALWSYGGGRLQKSLRARQVPFLAVGAAFSFLVMMFNVPIPAGTTGHAVGAVAIAIVLGPWAALLTVSVALIIQALLFGDGGITAIGANTFNMAFLMPFLGYIVFKVLNRLQGGKRVFLSAAIAGYIGLNFAALATAVELGIQPILHSVAGRPLYCPYPLSITVPAMMIEHLFLFGFIEAVVTGFVVTFMRKEWGEVT
jgi:cobalt/nickel transport system permease protein